MVIGWPETCNGCLLRVLSSHPSGRDHFGIIYLVRKRAKRDGSRYLLIVYDLVSNPDTTDDSDHHSSHHSECHAFVYCEGFFELKILLGIT